MDKKLLEKQTHRSFWKKPCIHDQMQAWFAYYLLKGKSTKEAVQMAAKKKGYPIED